MTLSERPESLADQGSITDLASKRRRVELRHIEIFLALAEELHFGRSAERLHVSQARVSQASAR